MNFVSLKNSLKDFPVFSMADIRALNPNFNPRNTQCIPACPVGPADRTGVVKVFAFLDLEQK